MIWGRTWQSWLVTWLCCDFVYSVFVYSVFGGAATWLEGWVLWIALWCAACWSIPGNLRFRKSSRRRS